MYKSQQLIVCLNLFRITEDSTQILVYLYFIFIQTHPLFDTLNSFSSKDAELNIGPLFLHAITNWIN